MISVDDIKKKIDPGYTVTKDTVEMGHPLDPDDSFEALLESYSIYYNVKRSDGFKDSPFAAEAVFDSKGEQYFLIKAAKVAEMHTAEYVYFAREHELTADRLSELDKISWEKGLAHVVPSANHKNTDVVLIVLADTITEEAKALVRKLKHSKNYRFALYGFSNYRLVAIESSKGIAYFNRQARILRSLIGNIFIHRSKTEG